MPVKKIVTWALVIFLVYYLVSDPKAAATDMHAIFSWLKNAATSLSKFVSAL